MPSTAFNALIAEPVTWMLCAYSRSHALGWRGPEYLIKLNHTLFANLDFDDAAPRAAAKLIMVPPDLGYIPMTPERLQRTLHRYFYLNALHNRDVAVWSTWDEDEGVYTLHQDEGGAELLAIADTETFIRDHVKVQSFVPETPSMDPREFALAAA